jgi:hypothetical protein
MTADAFDGDDSSEDAEAVSHGSFASPGGWPALNTASCSAKARW